MTGEGNPVFSVTRFTAAVKALLEGAFDEVVVEGEVSNHRLQSSGHQYFTLKDEGAQLACVLFAARGGGWRRPTMELRDGMQVQVRGVVTVYEPRGNYQLKVASVQAAGAGLLQARLEALKRKLAAEGLFDSERKKLLPRYPERVVIITSPTGAVIRDMLQVLRRRAPHLHVVLYPVRVQGAGAAAEIATAIADVSRWSESGQLRVNVMVIARGGGSIEDLWAFNEEPVVRAIFAANVPVISAVGHETDFTLADFAADVRAPTPSAAAELLAEETSVTLGRIAALRRSAARVIESAVGQASLRLLRTAGTRSSGLLRAIRGRVDREAQRLDVARERLELRAHGRLRECGERLTRGVARLHMLRPDQLLAVRRAETLARAGKVTAAMRGRLAALRARLTNLAEALRLLSPEGTLRRGYSITFTATGQILRSASDAPVESILETRLADGVVHSRVLGETQEAASVPVPRKPRKRTPKSASDQGENSIP
jgi:exodeoxyribonuclease VII large subunit